MPSAEAELAIPATEWLQTYTLSLHGHWAHEQIYILSENYTQPSSCIFSAQFNFESLLDFLNINV
jgi:hypothetical protein